jgi:hypothetical protein
MTYLQTLKDYNAWRRGAEMPQPAPAEIGEAIDTAIARLEVLEREHEEFFDRWHEERRKRERLATEVERCYQDVACRAGHERRAVQSGKHSAGGAGMTAKERQKLQRLEIENRELRQALDHSQDVGRKMLYEIVDLRAKLELVDLALHGVEE